MADEFPEFHDDSEMIEWFKSADLDAHDLKKALEVTVASKVGMSFAEPWRAVQNPGAGTGGAVGDPVVIAG
jgi:hypothetical protein